MKRNSILRISTAVLLFSGVLSAQNRSVSYTNTFNDFTRNAAYTASSENLNVLLDSKLMTNNLDGQFESLVFGLHSMLGESNSAGLKVMADNQGVLRNVNVELNYAKKIKLTTDQFLTLGTNAGFLQTSINTSALTTYVDQTDPTLYNGYFNQLRFTGGAGALYQYKKTLELGFSMPMLATGSEKVNTSMIFNASYAYKKNPESKWKITPQVVYYNLTDRSMLDAGLKGSWNDFISVYAAYRTNGSLLTALTIQTKSVTVGYAFNYNTGPVSNLYMGTNEIFLAVSLGGLNHRQADITDKNLPAIENRLQGVKENLTSIANSADSAPADEVKKKLKSANAELQKILKEYKTANVESLKVQIQELNSIIDTIEQKLKSKTP
ncbi:MAG TPA: PorP/SprF family type IX secretion system membrane protein [Bacteroidia bacterium]|jgi:type IX secretion system PorP/SprF family membrane protein|nr:PorP/SprF family type IX secretion system membrane protein [Bacteroidia bacterium]